MEAENYDETLWVHVTAARSVVLMFLVSEKIVSRARLLQRGGIKDWTGIPEIIAFHSVRISARGKTNDSTFRPIYMRPDQWEMNTHVTTRKKKHHPLEKVWTFDQSTNQHICMLSPFLLLGNTPTFWPIVGAGLYTHFPYLYVC